MLFIGGGKGGEQLLPPLLKVAQGGVWQNQSLVTALANQQDLLLLLTPRLSQTLLRIASKLEHCAHAFFIVSLLQAAAAAPLRAV